MLGLIKITCLLTQISCFKPVERKGHVCERDWSEKSLETKLSLSMGCSKVNGKQVDSTWELEEIYGK